MSSTHEPPPTLHCPLCNGPLHQADAGTFRCAIDHKATPAEVMRHTEQRLAEALWMAIEALDSEAMMLRLLSDTPDAEALGRRAEEQGELLRHFGRANTRNDAEGGS